MEFDALLEWIASLARTPTGAEAVLGLVPLADLAGIRREIAAVAEVRRHLDERGALLPARLPDARPALAALAVTGLRLEPGALRELALVLEAGSELRRSLLTPDMERLPLLAELGRGMADLSREARTVLLGIDPHGRLADEASPELARIRAARSRVGERLRRMLEGFLHEPGAEPVIRDDFVTERNGRFVIPVRSDAPRPVRGIVHASSSSGATRFVEPLESVELNNDLVRLAEEEQEEVHRVLSAWSDGLRGRLLDVRALVAGLTRVDGLQARAYFAAAAEGTEPSVEPGGPLLLSGLRHPLLDRRLRERDARSVPIRLSLDPGDRVLVLSGPNAGGKTVALKTIGLAVLMAQSGIPIPATDARLPLYRQVRADIGDHQSILADLSTFSAHVQAVAGFLETVDAPALFLFDEIGTGTEPTEGAALALSILETLQTPGITAVATTHLAAVKTWAQTAPRAASAAMEFDTERLRPTYRVLMGAAGVSAGLEIAERMGLPGAVVRRAREWLAPESRQSEEQLRRLRELIRDVETREEALDLRESRLEDERRELVERAARETETLRRRAGEALDRTLEELRALLREELASVREEAERERSSRRVARSERRLEQEHARSRAELAPARPAAGRAGWTPPDDPRRGMRVFVRSVGQEGEVLETRGEQVDVQLGGMLLRVGREDLLAPPAATNRIPSARAAVPSLSEGPTAPREILLVGKRVEEALDELDRFLDTALLAGHEEVRVIHGHGTGRLRAAVRSFLEAHRQVQSRRAGRPEEGGDAATIVVLK